MTKKGKLRKGISILLAVCMALPVGFVAKSETVHGKVIDADTTKRELWSTSFESADGFKTSTVDDKKGTANITTNELSYQINGNLSGEIESYSGSAAKNDNEVLKNLFDGDSGTKYLTDVKPSEVIVKLKSQRVIKSYAITLRMMLPEETLRIGVFRVEIRIMKAGKPSTIKQIRCLMADINKIILNWITAKHIASIDCGLQQIKMVVP